MSRLLGERKPFLMVTDPPYGIELDSEWRDRAGLNGCGPAEPSYLKKRTKGHRETSISGDTRADWSEAFALVPSLEVGYVWHASTFTVTTCRKNGQYWAKPLLSGLPRASVRLALVHFVPGPFGLSPWRVSESLSRGARLVNAPASRRASRGEPHAPERGQLSRTGLLFRSKIGYFVHLKSGDELIGGHAAAVLRPRGLAKGRQKPQKDIL